MARTLYRVGTMNLAKTPWLILGFAAFGIPHGVARAQEESPVVAQAEDTPQNQPQPEGAEQGDPGAVDVEEHLGPRPQPPEGALGIGEGEGGHLTVASGAGVGSDIAYASESVLELGGTLALTRASETTMLRLSPSIGYFFIDNFEITLFPDLTVIDVDGNTDVTVGGTLEPSYHLPITDAVLAFGGIGVGLKYADEPGVDFFFRPRLGMDLLVGRSGIFKPALFLDVGVNDGTTAGGFEAAFTVML